MVKLAHSYSALKMYENCPKNYFHQRVEKSVKDSGNAVTAYGERVHKSLELRLGEGTELTRETKAYASLVEAIEKLAVGADALTVEEEMTLNESLVPTGWWDGDAWLRSKIDVLVRKGPDAVMFDWKGLALDTPIPTPSGWTTMGGISVGDQVFDALGKPCSVVGKSQIKNIRCFEVVFSDTSRVVCDEEHLWKLHSGEVVGVQDLMGKPGKKQRAYVPRIAVAQPIDTPHTPLTIDPYVLGLWIADGKKSSGEVSKPDEFVWEEVQRRGYNVDMDTGGSSPCPTRTIQGLRTQLVSLGLLNNKHIPKEYMRAGYQQRLDLLRGLMDGDGNANPTRKQAVFTTVDKALSDAVCELLSSLGERPLQSSVVAKGFGKTTKAYPVSFRPIRANPFLLPRKADRVRLSDGLSPTTRYVVSVEEVPSIPTQCIAVDSNDHTFLCTERMIPTHNTGKRRPDFDQLELFAVQVFEHYPHIERVKTTFVWLKEMKMDHETYTRDQLPDLWEKILRKIKRIEGSMEHDNWPAKPSGLCNWCPCKTFCEYST